MNEIELVINDRIAELLSLVQIDNLQFEVEKKDLIEATAISATGERTCLIKVEVRESTHSIYIPNILLPEEMRGLGLGMRMLWLIFSVANHFKYSLYLIMLTDSFRQRMLNRGALPTAQHDILQIVKNTNLYSKDDPNNQQYIGVRL
ncbi:hypothetical protein [Sediminibacterium sp.]|uniref:hypothetical protein n=1 Tax=Sediminibacterium sp. TaxID=1917865 RepID=UPI0025D7DC13|nr:hypothetical protein [Sediminibacterium sp.]